ncbi:hypothetical protein SAMN04490182_0710 [Pseudomonas cedrina]|uniref:Uncharacterized protein n=2 Tax=Pseudomonas cedrina TaxID=651740 RepID=A0A1V2KGP3_PSECE|nr:hypothetical protein [Pseudomonas cedrina]ONH56575.1 hypothetical protein BLL36_04165 [Pseudomonas cedrina subsp. cedrina]SDS08992.1 hypothetical protein SAMN04490182_0710 [Pseudomonas cedrina]
MGSSTNATTGHLEATLGEESWKASSVVLYQGFGSFQVGGPEGGIAHKSVFFSLPDDVQPGVHKMNRATQVDGWFNPGENRNSWTTSGTDDNDTVTVHSVSEFEIHMSFEFVVMNRQFPEQRMRIYGDGKFEGASASNAAPCKQP